MKKGKLIVIDGIDNSGKATQTRLLAQRLKRNGKKVRIIDFPRYYDNLFGSFLGECLAGKHGDFLSLDPYISSVLFAADRFESSQDIYKWIKKGYIVVTDRYVSANQIHQGGKILDSQKRKKFLDWVERVEFEVFKIPRPDVIIYLDLPVEISQELSLKNRKEKKRRYLEGKRDVHESNEEHLKKAKNSALTMVKKNNKWKMVNCLENGKLMTKEKISDMIMLKLKNVIK